MGSEDSSVFSNIFNQIQSLRAKICVSFKSEDNLNFNNLSIFFEENLKKVNELKSFADQMYNTQFLQPLDILCYESILTNFNYFGTTLKNLRNEAAFIKKRKILTQQNLSDMIEVVFIEDNVPAAFLPKGTSKLLLPSFFVEVLLPQKILLCDVSIDLKIELNKSSKNKDLIFSEMYVKLDSLNYLFKPNFESASKQSIHWFIFTFYIQVNGFLIEKTLKSKQFVILSNGQQWGKSIGLIAEDFFREKHDITKFSFFNYLEGLFHIDNDETVSSTPRFIHEDDIPAIMKEYFENDESSENFKNCFFIFWNWFSCIASKRKVKKFPVELKIDKLIAPIKPRKEIESFLNGDTNTRGDFIIRWSLKQQNRLVVSFKSKRECKKITHALFRDFENTTSDKFCRLLISKSSLKRIGIFNGNSFDFEQKTDVLDAYLKKVKKTEIPSGYVDFNDVV
jgi:hypothetical protein